MENNIEQLKVLAEVFNTDKIVTSDQIEQVLEAILKILVRFKKENQALNDDTKTQVESIIDGISREHDRILASVEKSTQNVKSEATEAVEKALERLKEVTKEVLSYKAKDGEPGLDADEEVIVEKVLGKIVLPEYKETVLDGGEEIVDKINALPLNEKNQIDASHIKNLPVGGRGGSTARNLWQLNDVTLTDPTNDQVLKYDSTLKQWVNSTGGGGGTWGSITGTLSNQTDLQTALNAKQATLVSGTNIKTINGSSLLGSGDISISGVGTGTANTIAYWDTTTSIASLDTATYPSLTELTYVKGVTSAIQTQLNAKQASITGSDTRVLFFDGANNPAGDAGLTYNKTTNILSVSEVNSLTGEYLTLRSIGDDGFGTTAGIQILAQNALDDTFGGEIILQAGNGLTTGEGGSFTMQAGTGGEFGSGGGITAYAGNAGSTEGDGGSFSFTSGNGRGDGFSAGNVTFATGIGVSGATNGKFRIIGNSSSGTNYATLGTGNLTATRDFTFPNQSGVLALTSNIVPGGSNTQIQFNDSSVFGGDSGLTFNKTTNLLTVTGTSSAGAGIARFNPSSGTSYTQINDNGTVEINADVSTGSVPLLVKHNGSTIAQITFQGTTLSNNFNTNGDTGSYAFTGGTTFHGISGSVGVDLRYATTAQAFRVYNTYTSSTNYERGVLQWDTNVLEIGTEKGSGGGTARGLALQTDATTRLAIDATGAITISGSVALGANNLTMTGSLAATGARVTKGWFTDIESTNMPTVGGTAILTSLTAPSFTTVELGAGGATDTTLSRVSAGVVAIEGVNIVTTSSTDTLTNKTLTAPKFADLGFIADANGNELIIFDTVTSAVNELTLANAATGNNPAWTASGGDTNIGIDWNAKGTGTFNLRGNATQAATLRFYEDTDDGSNYTSFKVGTQAGNVDYTLPTAAPASNGYVLSATTAGVMSWIAPGAGSFIGVRLTQSSGASITANTLTALSFDTETFDTDTMHSGGNPTRITFTTAGYYIVTGVVSTDANASVYSGVRLNGTTYINKEGVGNSGASTANGTTISFIYQFSAADYIELFGTFGTTNTTKSGVDGCYFSAAKIG